MGSREKAKLEQHLQSVQTLQAAVNGHGGGSAACGTPAPPNLQGANPTDQAATLAMPCSCNAA